MNHEFLSAIFGTESPWCHVTDFSFPPDDIPPGQHLTAWKGDYNCRYTLQPDTNQYFTISLFYCDEQQQARRRKALFRQTNCIVLDDVREKLSVDACRHLPPPSWVLETSEGSEQWGYILTEPCTDRGQVENLLDGLVSNGLAPDGRDPGMKGVTRYVRLPDGINNKRSKGFFRCRLKTWHPFTRCTMEQLAAPFRVDLHAPRRETRTDGAADVPDHPLMRSGLHIKEVRSDGRFDITCPWVHEHTGADDSGAAVFTNGDGSFGFKCHHGACQERTGRDLVRYLDGLTPGFGQELNAWQVTRNFAGVKGAGSGEAVTPDSLMDALRRERPSSKQAREAAAALLQLVDTLPKIDRQVWHDDIRDVMQWNVQTFKEILDDLRQGWYTKADRCFYDTLFFVREINQFYDWRLRIFYSPEAMQNGFSDQDSEARRTALQEGRVQKVDKLDYAPRQARTFEIKGCVYGNTWDDKTQEAGEPGDCSWWTDHFNVLDWTEHREHMLDWMAYTLQHPEHKINHALILGSGEGTGKDFLLYPLIKAMGDNAQVIGGEELAENFNEYLLSTKYLHVNEIEMGDHRDAKRVSQKLKPLAAAPPETLKINKKGVSRVAVRNVVNCTMTTNSTLPVQLNGPSRRFYAIWSDFNPRDARDCMLPHWLDYWEERWNWMHDGGWKHCVHALMTRDLKGFNPFAAPPMTDFVREIKDASKGPVLQTIETFIRKKHGVFVCDILSAADMEDVLKVGALFGADMLTDGKYFTARRIGRELRECGSYRQIRTGEHRVWILRNPEKYAGLKPGEVHDIYYADLQKARRDVGLQVVSF